MAVSNYRRNVNRCKARKVEAPRTWQCQLRAGHAGEHVSYSGQRYWGGEVRHKVADVTSDLWHAERALLGQERRHEDTQRHPKGARSWTG